MQDFHFLPIVLSSYLSYKCLNDIIVQEPRGQNFDFVAPPPTDGISWYHMKVQDLSCPTRVGVLTGGVSVTMVTRVEYTYQ